MQSETVKVRDLEFQVNIDGGIAQSQRVSPYILDEVRLEASRRFLFNHVPMTKEQREFWSGVSKTTEVRNLAIVR